MCKSCYQVVLVVTDQNDFPRGLCYRVEVLRGIPYCSVIAIVYGLIQTPGEGKERTWIHIIGWLALFESSLPARGGVHRQLIRVEYVRLLLIGYQGAYSSKHRYVKVLNLL